MTALLIIVSLSHQGVLCRDCEGQLLLILVKHCLKAMPVTPVVILLYIQLK